MQLTALSYPALALVLVAGGALLIANVARTVKKRVAARVDLIAPALDAPSVTRRGLEAGGLVKEATSGSSAAQLAEVARLCRRLGIDPRHAARVLTGLRLVSAFTLAAAGFVLSRHFFAGRASAAIGMLAAGVLAVVGWLGPALLTSYRAKQRTNQVVEGFPEALELMVVCVEAGLALEQSIDRVVAELKLSRPVLATELELTSADMKILPDRDQALHNMAERTSAPSVRAVMTTLSQTLRYGTPLAQALRVAASELRNDALTRLEERANRLPTLLTLPMMLLIMPTIILIVGGPAMIRLLDAFAK